MKPISRLTKFETILGSFLFFIPLILILLTGEVRSSISDYAYSDKSYLLPTLLTLSGSLFMYNGVIREKKWYNIILGFSLIGVALTPHLDYKILHYTFTMIFFIGGSIVMVVFSSKKQRIYKYIASSIMTLSILLSFGFNVFSVLIGEWIGLLPVTIHFIGESLNKID